MDKSFFKITTQKIRLGGGFTLGHCFLVDFEKLQAITSLVRIFFYFVNHIIQKINTLSLSCLAEAIKPESYPPLFDIGR